MHRDSDRAARQCLDWKNPANGEYGSYRSALKRGNTTSEERFSSAFSQPCNPSIPQLRLGARADKVMPRGEDSRGLRRVGWSERKAEDPPSINTIPVAGVDKVLQCREQGF